MPNDAENLKTIRSNLLTYLAAESANPKPSYSKAGQSVSWDSHRQSILDEIKQLDELIEQAEGAWQVDVRGVT